MQDFRNLKVWQRSHRLTLAVYEATSRFPVDETYGLRSQIRRCAFSIPSNIAEGSGRGTDADFGRFLHMAMGSAAELDYFLLLAHDLGFLTSKGFVPLCEEIAEIRRMFNGLILTVRKNHRKPDKAGARCSAANS